MNEIFANSEEKFKKNVLFYTPELGPNAPVYVDQKLTGMVNPKVLYELCLKGLVLIFCMNNHQVYKPVTFTINFDPEGTIKSTVVGVVSDDGPVVYLRNQVS